MAVNFDYKMNEEQEAKLLDFFSNTPSGPGHAKELAHIFEKAGVLNEYAVVMSAQSDGCIANISAQAKSALYGCLITDPCASISYSNFSGKISAPIAWRKDIGDILGSSSSSDLLSNEVINESRLLPNGFINSLIEEFSVEDKTVNGRKVKGDSVRKAWDFIVDGESGQYKDALLIRLSETGMSSADPDMVNKIVKEEYGIALA